MGGEEGLELGTRKMDLGCENHHYHELLWIHHLEMPAQKKGCKHVWQSPGLPARKQFLTSFTDSLDYRGEGSFPLAVLYTQAG